MSLSETLAEFGCTVLGPFGTLADAEDFAEDELDGAVLDINLRGTMVYPLAERLLDRGVPVVFCSGYVNAGPLPEPFADCVCITKPYTTEMLRRAMERSFGGFSGAGSGTGSDEHAAA